MIPALLQTAASDPSRAIGLAIDVAYLVSGLLVFVAVRLMAMPASARRSNLVGALALAIAVVATLLESTVVSYRWIVLGLAIGGVGGALISAPRTPLSRVAPVLAGCGAGAVACVAAALWHRMAADTALREWDIQLALVAASLLATAALATSVIVAARARRLRAGRDAFLPPASSLVVAASGWGVSALGVAMRNSVLIIAGAIVGGAAGVLARLTARAVNRGPTAALRAAITGRAGRDGADERPIRTLTVDDAAVMLAYAQNVVIVPGYGLALAQAQHAARELAAMLEQRGVSVRYLIHPLAGRMPGHMNVLLAEADVPYAQLRDLETGDADLAQADVVVIVGANDITNPAARQDRASPLWGIPIVEAERARSVIVIKRGLGRGHAGVDNELFHGERTAMLFGDAQRMLSALATEVTKH